MRLAGALVVAVVAHVIVASVGADGVIAAVLSWADVAAPSWDGGPLDALGWLTVDLATAATLAAAVSSWRSGCRDAATVCVSALAIVVAASVLVAWVLFAAARAVAAVT